ncbi:MULTISPECIES: accessory gene regulator ArgB-like protein [Paenibacillus]|uniref:Accessory gene regulator B family protein n=1 Tax=Paenibacillus oceani TaxID=2772510 RepID=A0A927CDV6_9BACL|nr:accessory gene regulator B family protein [Paenibacillus oceani]MBD2865800.1 accessory gene regulator B family protein [Paenibacillus oceani]
MIEALAGKIANKIKRADEQNTAHVEVLKYGLIIVINYALPVVASLTIGWITNQFSGTLFSVLAFTLLRLASGGFHFKSANVCTVVSILIISIPPHVSLSDHWITICTAVSLLLIFILAPANIRGYARMPEKYFPIMKIVSVLIVGSNLLWHSSILAIVFIVQGVLLLPLRREVKS